MREYVEWQQGRTRVRVHRRVIAGLEREAPGQVAGVVYGSVTAGDVAIEDYSIGAGSGGGPLEPVGYFRVVETADDAAEESGFGRLHVVLVFRRGPDGVELERLHVRPEQRPAAAGGGAGHRVLYRAVSDEPPAATAEGGPWRRLIWPVAAVVLGLVIGAGAYMWMSGGPRTDSPVRESAGGAAAVPMPPPPAVSPPALSPPATEKEAPPSQSQADRLIDPETPLSRTERAAIQREVKEALRRWSESRMRGNIDAHADAYADTVEPYFKKARASRDEVEQEVRRSQERYGRLTTLRISDVQVAATDRDHAIANFRKRWSTAGQRFAGEEKEQLKFVRDGGRWKIASEQELHVYWVRKK